MRTLGVLGPCALLVSVLPADAARAEHAGLWVSPSGVRALLTREGYEYELRSDSAPFLFQFFGDVPSPGTLLLRMRVTGEALSGTAYTYASSCILAYPVQGTLTVSTLQWSGMQPKDKAAGTCRVTRSAFTSTTLQLVSSPPKPAPPAPPQTVALKETVVSAPTTPFRFGSSLLMATTLSVVAFIVLAFLRLAYLRRLRTNRLLPRPLPRAPREPASAFSSSLPSSSGKLLGSRTEIIKADAVFVEEHTNWLLHRTAQTNAAANLVEARLRFAEKLAHLASVPALMNTSDPHATPTSFSLTLSEIEQMIAGMPEVSPQLRSALLRLLQARLKEKLQ
jgi:hypothetical protein